MLQNITAYQQNNKANKDKTKW